MLSTIIGFIAAHAGISAAGALGVGSIISLFLPKILNWSITQKALVVFLQSAQYSGKVVGVWLRTGPARHIVVIPIFILVAALIWLSRFRNSILSEEDDSTRALNQAVSDALAKAGSQDEQAYYDLKALGKDASPAAKIISAINAGPQELTIEQSVIKDQILGMGAQLQDSRLGS